MPDFTGILATSLTRLANIQLAHVPAADDEGRAWTYDGEGATHTYGAGDTFAYGADDTFTYGNTPDWTYITG